MKKKQQGISGYWYEVRQFETCCDCGLCHQKEYKVVFKKGEPRIFFRAWRDKERTKLNRNLI
jgi:hypothetical protein